MEWPEPTDVPVSWHIHNYSSSLKSLLDDSVEQWDSRVDLGTIISKWNSMTIHI